MDCGHAAVLEAANRLKEHARKALTCIQDREKSLKLSEAIQFFMYARDYPRRAFPVTDRLADEAYGKLDKTVDGATTCAGCGQPLQDGTTYRVDGALRWHPSCFNTSEALS